MSAGSPCILVHEGAAVGQAPIRRTTADVGFGVLLLLLAAGCHSPIAQLTRFATGGWTADYETAESLARASGQGMVIYYTNVDLTRPDPLRAAVKAGAAAAPSKDYVHCVLFRSYEPDRRYVAQYGVDRAPAVITVHPDGTYHARSGTMSAEQVASFLVDASPPGASPRINRFIPREVNYSWHSSLESAEEAAQRTGQPILIVLDRWMSRDWQRLKVMLDRREVYTRFADMVHCRPGAVWPSAGQVAERFEVRNLPAVVILRPDGSHETMELPNSYESLVRFADHARLGGAAPNVAAAATSEAATAEP